MPKTKLTEKRLVFVTGKGGVGKSALSAGLAQAFEHKEKSVALVELEENAVLHRFFGLAKPTQNRKDISRNITLFNLDTKDILKEFIDERFPVKGVYRAFFDNRFVHYFLNATPGFNEFLLMNKLWHLVERDIIHFDTVIVDAPATGHLLALLEVPQIITEAMHTGPIKDASAHVLKLIRDDLKTGVVVASLAGEMPVSEAILLHERLKNLKIDAALAIFNKIHPEFTKKVKNETVVGKILQINKIINEEQEYYFKKIKKVFGRNILTMPEIYSFSELEVAKKIGEIMAENL